MRRIIRLACLMLPSVLVSAQANAEADWTDRMVVGGKIGPDLARHGGPGANDESVSSSYKIGFTLGSTAEYHFTRIWAAQADIAFTLKGAHSSRDGMESGAFTMSYIDIPLLARATLPIGEKVKSYANLGPALGILLDANFDRADGTHFDLENSFETIDLGLVLGVGAAMEAGETGSFTLDLRYNYGLTNIDKSAAGENDDGMNRTLYLLVGYRTNLDDLLQRFRRQAPPTDTQPTPAPTSPPGEPPAP